MSIIAPRNVIYTPPIANMSTPLRNSVVAEGTRAIGGRVGLYTDRSIIKDPYVSRSNTHSSASTFRSARTNFHSSGSIFHPARTNSHSSCPIFRSARTNSHSSGSIFHSASSDSHSSWMAALGSTPHQATETLASTCQILLSPNQNHQP